MKFQKIHLIYVAVALILSPLVTLANVINGDFEQWDGSKPTGWGTIDSGLLISSTSDTVISGSRAAKLTITTRSQSNTDLLQSMSVTRGKTYNFAVSIYHTKGKVKARLYVDGYRGYSEPSQVGQWQNLNYSYTATSDKEIKIGLRFYDINGFDNSEVVYVDNFKPTQDNIVPSKPSSHCSDTMVKLTLMTDNYGSETSWNLKNKDSQVLFSGDNLSDNKTYNKNMCLVNGRYIFEILDSYGDGICCSTGDGSYKLEANGKKLGAGGQFNHSEKVTFALGGSMPLPPKPPMLSDYYKATEGKTGFALKSSLYNIINNHNSRGYRAIWTLIKDADVDNYYEKDGSILDLYSEKPSGSDSVNFVKISDQCGQYRQEGGCYNREHSFPKSWFGGKIEPMNSDGHHIFATDGYVNAKRSNWPFGEVASTTYISSNGSKLGSASSELGYSGIVFEPIDAFKGDFARAYFYMATRYQNEIASWEGNSNNANAVLNGTNTQVFEPWMLKMLKRWHKNDPVDKKEIDRNEAVYQFQNNRNPFIDHPEFVSMIWGD